ncbi:MAG: restriction endonuclease subunit R, partial [Saprospiraceae bacterium]
KIYTGEAVDDSTEDNLRRIQIREAIRAHLAREEQLHGRRIKVLSLFFIDSVVKYRDYDREDTLGEYARIFEEEYAALKKAKLAEIAFESAYHTYLKRDDAASVHEGYFSIDKKSKQLRDPKSKKDGSSDDVAAYDLILKDKERLLSLEEPRRFIFSHSALREGWDNPNVFVMCFLKHTVYDEKKSDHTRRQELGRGLRIAVQSDGQGGYVRMDDPSEVHDINVLTVVTDEQYSSYVKRLQEEYKDAVDGRPKRADEAFFLNKELVNEEGKLKIDERLAAQLEHYLVKNDYRDFEKQITSGYYDAKEKEELAVLPEELQPYESSVHQLIQSVYTDAALPGFDRGGRDKVVNINNNYHRQEFQSLWNKINKQQVYQVDFSTEELIRNAIPAINRQLTVTAVTYQIERGVQKDSYVEGDMTQGAMFTNAKETNFADEKVEVQSEVRYDLLGRIAAQADITRATAAEILKGIDPGKFEMYKFNPEQFIVQISRLIVEQKASLVVEHLTYDRTGGTYDADIFVPETIPYAHATEKLRKHIYDYVKTDSQGERTFAEKLDAAQEVVVYAKLPGKFKIPTPVGDYNPDWAIVFEEDAVKHIYFIAETKGSMSTLQLRGIEDVKINCARKFFERLREQSGDDARVRYDVVSSYGGMMEMVR